VAGRKLGQHFLIRGSVLERIARAACPEQEPLVVEIGPGRGALTARLLPRTERLIAIELDPYLVAFVRRKFAGESRLEVIEGDALETDLGQWGPAVITGNLPYYAATAILARALELGPLLRRAVFLVQKEVGARAAATAGSRDYGYLSVATQLYADVEALCEVPAAAFHPPPAVDSAVVRLTPRNRALELGISDPVEFLRFVGLCFRQKRKTLRNNLAGVYGRDLVDTWPEAGMRAEQIELAGFAAMYRRLVP
jgi:16S rRNA (adenine1518-N6/adenine1519-N6)-dimethyltransferase